MDRAAELSCHTSRREGSADRGAALIRSEDARQVSVELHADANLGRVQIIVISPVVGVGVERIGNGTQGNCRPGSSGLSAAWERPNLFQRDCLLVGEDAAASEKAHSQWRFQ